MRHRAARQVVQDDDGMIGPTATLECDIDPRVRPLPVSRHHVPEHDGEALGDQEVAHRGIQEVVAERPFPACSPDGGETAAR